LLNLDFMTARQVPQDRWLHLLTTSRVFSPRLHYHSLGIFALFAGLSLSAAQPVWAMSPTGTLEAFFSRTNTVLQSVDPAHGLTAPRQAIRDLVNEVFDFRAAAALALGSVWLSRVPEEQDVFTRLFAVLLERGFIATIGSKASVAGGVRIQYLGETVDGEVASVATTLLTRGGQELPVEYWMVRRGDRWKVRDVVVDGVSLVMNYRAQFSRILAAYPYAGLVARMQAETPAEPPPAAPLPAKPAPSTAVAVPDAPLAPAVARDVPADRTAKLSAVKPKPTPPGQQIATSKNGGRGEAPPSGANTSKPVPVAAPVATPGDRQRPGDVVGRLLVSNRSGAERDIASLLARMGGTTLSRQRGTTITVVEGLVPQLNYPSFAAGLRGLGSWQLEAERSPLPHLFHVTVKLAEHRPSTVRLIPLTGE
jgi:phospholipid transport system substrate-binding protein